MLVSIVIVASNLAVIASLFAVFKLFQRCIEGVESRTRQDLTQAVRAILEPAAEGQPSALAVYSDQVATLFAARIVQQFKTAAGGIASGVSKEAQTEAMGQLAGTSPWMALLAGLLPKKFRNSIMSSPQFTGQLSMLAGGQPGGNNHADQTPSVASRLKRQA